QQAHDRLTIGEDADHPLASTNFFIEALDRIGCAQALAIERWKGKNGSGIVEAALEGGDGKRSAVLVLGTELGQQDARRLAVGSLEDGAHPAMHLVVERLGRGVTDIGRQMRLTALPRRALELEAYGVH